MMGGSETNFEAILRRWLALARGELRPIGDLNRIVACLAKFSRSEIKKRRRRIRTEPGVTGDRQAIVGYWSLVYGAEKPALMAPEEVCALPAVLALAVLFGPKSQPIKDEKI
jgi:hypothetical protein